MEKNDIQNRREIGSRPRRRGVNTASLGLRELGRGKALFVYSYNRGEKVDP